MSRRALLLPLCPADGREHHHFGHAQEADCGVWAGFARADRDTGAVGPNDLDDRADVTDLAIIAEAFFERLHLLGNNAAHLRLIEGHQVLPFAG